MKNVLLSAMLLIGSSAMANSANYCPKEWPQWACDAFNNERGLDYQHCLSLGYPEWACEAFSKIGEKGLDYKHCLSLGYPEWACRAFENQR